MKITIAYTGEETRKAETLLSLIRTLCPGIKTRRSDRYPPYKHLYLSTEKPHHSNENA